MSGNRYLPHIIGVGCRVVMLGLLSLAHHAGAAGLEIQVMQQHELQWQLMEQATAKPLVVHYMLPKDGAGRLLADRSGQLYRLSRSREDKGRLYDLRSGSLVIESVLLRGVERRSLMETEGGWIVGVDQWLGGGGVEGGFYRLQRDGTYRRLKTSKNFPGLSDLIADKEGGLFCDFEADNIWRWSGEGQKEQPLLDQTPPKGLYSLLLQPQEHRLYASNRHGDWPFDRTAGIYRIDGGNAVKVFSATQVGDLAWSNGRLFPAGVYFINPEAGTVERLLQSGKSRVVVAKLNDPGDLIFDQRNGAMWVIEHYPGKDVLLRIGANAAVPDFMRPARPGKTVIAGAGIADVVVHVDDSYGITDSQGRLQLPLPSGVHRIRIRHRGYVDYVRQTDSKSGKRLNILLHRIESLSLRGKVTTSDGLPVAGADLTWKLTGVDRPIWEPMTISTNEKGEYVLEELPVGAYDVQVSAPGFETRRQPAVIAKQRVDLLDFTLDAVPNTRRTVNVLLIDGATGQPLRDVDVILEEAPGSGSITYGKSDSRGHVQLHYSEGIDNHVRNGHLLLSNGRLVARAHKKGYVDGYAILNAGQQKKLRILLYPQRSRSETEPNDRRESANLLHPGERVSFHVDKVGDRDWFFFELAIAQRITLSVDAAPIETYVRLLDAQGDLLQRQGAGRGSANRWSAFLKPGRYYVQVEEWGKNEASEQELGLSFETEVTADASEPNDEWQQATTVQAGQVVRGYLAPAEDIDWFKLHIVRAGRLRLQMPPHPLERYLTLFAASDKDHALARQGAGRKNSLLLTYPVSPGDYLIQLSEWGRNEASTQPWKLSVQLLPDDAVVDPTFTAKPEAVRHLPLDGSAAATIWPTGDRDSYQFDAPGAGVLRVQGVAPGNMELYLQLLDAAARVLAQGGIEAGGTRTLEAALQNAQPVYLQVSEWGDNNASQRPYTLHADWIPTDALDYQQHNDTLKTATPIENSALLQGSILPAGDQDWYRIKLDHPARLRLHGDGPSGETYLQFMDQNGAILAKKGFGARRSVEFSVDSVRGVRYFNVAEWGNNQKLPNYLLKFDVIRAEPQETGATLAQDAPRILRPQIGQVFRIDQSGDVDHFIFSAPEAGQWHLNLLAWGSLYLTAFTDGKPDAVLKQGLNAGGKHAYSFELKKDQTLRLDLTHWGSFDSDDVSGVILMAKDAVDPSWEKILVSPGKASATVLFSRQRIETGSAAERVDIDADGDGRMDFDLQAEAFKNWRYAAPGLYQAVIKEYFRNHPVVQDAAGQGMPSVDAFTVSRRIWVDASRQDDSTGLQMTVDGLPRKGTLMQAAQIIAHVRPSGAARIRALSFFLDGKLLQTLHSPPYEIELPWQTLGQGVHTLVAEVSDSHGEKQHWSQEFTLSEFFALLPAEGARLTGSTVRVSWLGNRSGQAVVRYRQSGATAWHTARGKPGRRRSVLLKGLQAGHEYVYQVKSAQNWSPLRHFSLIKGLAFGQSRYGAVIERDYDQRMGISVRNNGDQALQVVLKCGKPDDPLLLAGFVGDGSADEPFTLQPGAERHPNPHIEKAK